MDYLIQIAHSALRRYRKIPSDVSIITTIMDKRLAWDTFAFLRAFSNSHGSNPSPHPTNNVKRVYPEFFPSFNFV